MVQTKARLVSNFFRYSRYLLPFRIQLTILDRKEIDISPLSYAKFNDLSMKCFKSGRKKLKNSAGKPSIPGHLLFFNFFNASPISQRVSSPSSMQLWKQFHKMDQIALQ